MLLKAAQIGKMGNWFWHADPAANYQKVLDDAAEEIGDATSAIEANKALVNSLTRQVADNEREVARLDARVKNSLAEDPADKGGKAAEYVMQLSVAQSHMAKNKDQLGKVQGLYQNNLKKIEMARRKIKEAQDLRASSCTCGGWTWPRPVPRSANWRPGSTSIRRTSRASARLKNRCAARSTSTTPSAKYKRTWAPTA